MLVITRAGCLQEWLQRARRALTVFVFITIIHFSINVLLLFFICQKILIIIE